MTLEISLYVLLQVQFAQNREELVFVWQNLPFSKHNRSDYLHSSAFTSGRCAVLQFWQSEQRPALNPEETRLPDPLVVKDTFVISVKDLHQAVKGVCF